MDVEVDQRSRPDPNSGVIPDREIQGHAVSARLSTTNDLTEHMYVIAIGDAPSNNPNCSRTWKTAIALAGPGDDGAWRILEGRPPRIKKGPWA
jgi:hypothetical protein